MMEWYESLSSNRIIFIILEIMNKGNASDLKIYIISPKKSDSYILHPEKQFFQFKGVIFFDFVLK